MKKLSLFLTLLAIALFAQAETIQHVYHFSQPIVSERDGYQQIGFQGCLPNGTVGEPTLPWQSISLMLPQGQEAVAVNVAFSDFMELEGSFNLYPYQRPRPISNEEEIPFAKNEALYRSGSVYPAQSFSSVNTQYLNGVAFAFGGFTPVRYVPSTGKVSYARTVTVTIETAMSRDDHSRKLWLTPENEQSIKRLAQNANMLGTYTHRNRAIGGYDMLVITAEEWVPRFGEYLNLYNNNGIRTRIVALEDIYAFMEGRDPQEQIRNYIIQEYETNGIQMVSLGGDVSIIPFRFLYCWAQEGEEDQLPSDMYYACLDGSLNDDGDDRWGEVGEDDLLPEIGIGRLPFNNEAQFETIMHKTFSYLQTPVLGEFTTPILGAEHLGDGYYGNLDMERLIGEVNDYDYTTYGYPEDYNFKRYYATPQHDFRGGEFRNVIITGGQYVHHVGHANTDIVAGWTGSMMSDNYFSGNDGIHHNYMLFHSHGCICGDFASSCVLEKLITIQTGFVVTTGNSRYGWYVPWGDGMAAHIHREFVDAYCHDLIPSVGMALREAKIATAPWVTAYGEENGCMRWNIYCLNVLGDAGLYPWFEEPITPDVTYQQGILQGTTSTIVTVKSQDRALEGFRVSIFKGEDLIAFGMTDANGNAILEFADPNEVLGELRLIVTGQSAWPQQLPMTGLTEDAPFLFVEDYGYQDSNINGITEYGETINLTLAIANPSLVDIDNVTVDIACDDPQIEVTQSHSEHGSIPAESNLVTGNGGTFVISDTAIDQSRVVLQVNCSADGNTWVSEIPLYISAPVLQFTDIVIDDSEGDGNGFIDPGEHVIMHVSGTNTGHTPAPDTYLTVTCPIEGLNMEETTIYIGEVGIGEDFTADLAFTPDYDIPGGTTFHLDMALHTGAYATHQQHPVSVGTALETFESGDFNFLEWAHTGDQPWVVTDEDAHSGTYCARSGAIGDDEVSKLYIFADLFVDGEVSFWFKTSTQYHYDYFAFMVDGRKKEWWSGENDWTYASFELPAGHHCLLWLYDKSRENQAGSDCAWIDDITFPHASIVNAVVESETENNVLYPNPSTGHFTLELEEESHVTIYNLLGQIIMTRSDVAGTQHIDLGNAPKGLYFVQIESGNTIDIKKITIE